MSNSFLKTFSLILSIFALSTPECWGEIAKIQLYASIPAKFSIIKDGSGQKLLISCTNTKGLHYQLRERTGRLPASLSGEATYSLDQKLQIDLNRYDTITIIAP